ncbi:MAG: tRNA uridine-5-carboxymethylaminomethyl(34) synthesis GTPase MnmE [Rhodospirillales bacterium]|nr:tRNA uridine-5-carboxymethylaminomethyl(34) synthesis GTPase MnmE [Rhodospirillales bacterium]MCB9964694.1 tRNA uridine-5-carboxymethylaminomethyl(34) synthesis GTPase MnmE [Rhodospirillales bacterium]MCB9979984.1 tRNA uridine-5-carboxymethylaminomethyl(34) synthesis GTPase MnmE [Rhodospirillales bacterium]
MTHTPSTETIFALATPPGRSGVAVIRVSGPQALLGLTKLTRDMPQIPPRYACFTSLHHPETNTLIDQGVVIYFQAPNSFTGEEVVEYQLHGSPAVIQELFAFLGHLPNHRPADRGEFTRRAYENGKLDLTEAEAVADLIDAETSAQKDQALAQLSGSLRNLYENWAEKLTRCLAFLEADLDFPDEDLPEGVSTRIRPEIAEIMTSVQNHLHDNRRGERLRDGIKIAVIGAPNAGKSSLVNALAQREVAIISDLAGTTRDVLEVHLDLGGYPVILSDTAGLKPELLAESGDEQEREQVQNQSAHDRIESEGIRRALTVAKNADLKLLVFEAGTPPDKATLSLKDDKSLQVFNKIDHIAPEEREKIEAEEGIGISVTHNLQIDHLLARLTDRITALLGRNDAPALTRERHRRQLQECVACLEKALTAPLPELMAEDVRLAVRALGKITGRVDVEDLLDIIFSEFCIGK